MRGALGSWPAASTKQWMAGAGVSLLSGLACVGAGAGADGELGDADGIWGARRAAQVVGDAGAEQGLAAEAPALDDAAPAEADAGTPSAADAGAEPVLQPLQPPAPLPDDIVEQSSLHFHGVADGEALSARGVWRVLKRSRAICLGELHNNPFHHNLQRRVLERLGELQRAHPERRGELAIGYEMFQRPFQEPLSAYMRGELEEAELLEQTEYAQRWGADLALYRPLFEANRDQGLPGLALNAPTELTRTIARGGLEALTPELEALLPELVLDDEEHRAFIFGLLGLSHADPAASGLESLYRAQVTWDETMALTASEWLTGSDDRRLLAFAGTAHCHESAIPRRVARRSGIEMLSAAPVLESELEAFPEDWIGYELLIVLED